MITIQALAAAVSSFYHYPGQAILPHSSPFASQTHTDVHAQYKERTMSQKEVDDTCISEVRLDLLVSPPVL